MIITIKVNQIVVIKKTIKTSDDSTDKVKV